MFDWSSLDRSLLMGFSDLIKQRLVGVPRTPRSIVSDFRKLFKYLGVPIKLAQGLDPKLKSHEVAIGGTYWATLDKKGQQPITILFNFSPTAKKIALKPHQFKLIKALLADTILHEIIHLRQYRRRGFKDIPGYQSTASLSRDRKQQEYLGHPDEIDAYAFNISCNLVQKFKNPKDITEYLNIDASDQRIRETLYVWYLRTFDNNQRHRVIKKLKKKIIYYLPYAELGRPYKTTDWLR